MSSMSESCPRGVCLRKKTFGSVVTMCKCFDCGRYAANASTVTTCVHQAIGKTTPARSREKIDLRIALAIGGGREALSGKPARRTGAPQHTSGGPGEAGQLTGTRA